MDTFEQIGQGMAMIDLGLMIFFIPKAISNYINSKRLGDEEGVRNSYKGCLKGCLFIIALNIIALVLLVSFL